MAIPVTGTPSNELAFQLIDESLSITKRVVGDMGIKLPPLRALGRRDTWR
jgi:hypothetical protein